MQWCSWLVKLMQIILAIPIAVLYLTPYTLTINPQVNDQRDGLIGRMGAKSIFCQMEEQSKHQVDNRLTEERLKLDNDSTASSYLSLTANCLIKKKDHTECFCIFNIQLMLTVFLSFMTILVCAIDMVFIRAAAVNNKSPSQKQLLAFFVCSVVQLVAWVLIVQFDGAFILSEWPYKFSTNVAGRKQEHDYYFPPLTWYIALYLSIVQCLVLFVDALVYLIEWLINAKRPVFSETTDSRSSKSQREDVIPYVELPKKSIQNFETVKKIVPVEEKSEESTKSTTTSDTKYSPKKRVKICKIQSDGVS